MNKLFLIIIAILLTLPGMAQERTIRINYSYDASGNRVSRVISFSKSITKSSDSTANTKENSFTDQLGRIKIVLYPNPTKGLLTIEVTNLPDNTKGGITIADASGKLLQESTSLKSTNTIDLSNQSPGMYFLRIRAGDEVTEWKVLKE